MSYLAVTTCNADHWSSYGRAMVATFRRHWPAEVPLRLYTEGFTCDIDGVETDDLHATAPWLGPWKAERTKAQRGYKTGKHNYRYDAVRFSHKIAAIGSAAESLIGNSELNSKAQNYNSVLIWLDADTVTHAPVTVEWLTELFPLPADVAWLDRATKYPECGFLMFRLPSAWEVIQDIVMTYRTGAVFRFAEWHDSWIIWKIVEAAVAKGEIKVASLSGEGRNSHHPFAVGLLGAKMDHLKGSRKAEGRSRRADFPRPRSEPYWR